MNTSINMIEGKLTKMMFGMVAAVLLGAASAQQAQAQIILPPPPTTLNYSFSVPVAKAVPNPCTGGVELITGKANFTIQTIQDSSSFKFNLNSSSSGKGEDALPDGSLLLDGTQKSQYDYASTMTGDVTFPSKPSSILQTVTVAEYLVRQWEGTTPDSFIMKTVFEITFTNGVPAAPVLRSIDTRCAQ